VNLIFNRNRRGHIVVQGKTDKSLPQEEYGFRELNRRDRDTEDYLSPEFDTTVKEVTREVEQMRAAGKLRPFIEGEAVGVCPPRVRRVKVTRHTVSQEHNRRMEEKRAEMLKLRAKNDKALKEALA
jgi:hypothetical protein